MNNWHKALPPQVHSAEVAVVRDRGRSMRGQPGSWSAHAWLQEVQWSDAVCAPPGCPRSGGRRMCEVLTTGFLSLGCLASMPENLKVTMSAPDGQPGPTEGGLPFFFFFFLRLLPLLFLFCVQKNFLLALKNLLTLRGPSLSASTLECPEAISGLERESWPTPLFLLQTGNTGQCPFPVRVLSCEAGAGLCLLAQLSKRAVRQGRSQVFNVPTFWPRVFTSGNFAPRKLVGELFRN